MSIQKMDGLKDIEERKYRMYGLVSYNLSPIQQGIQFGHAVVEYSQHHRSADYLTWAALHKTFIILNGGTTNNNPERKGTLNQHLDTLIQNDVRVSWFEEPDLGDQITAVVFLVDDRVWDKKTWPDYNGTYFSDYRGTFPTPDEYSRWKRNFSEDEAEAEKIVFLREFLSNFKLA